MDIKYEVKLYLPLSKCLQAMLWEQQIVFNEIAQKSSSIKIKLFCEAFRIFLYDLLN